MQNSYRPPQPKNYYVNPYSKGFLHHQTIEILFGGVFYFKRRSGYGALIMNRLEELISEKYDYADIDTSLPTCRLYAHLGYQTVDHGIWECKNNVIQVYEIMKKQLANKSIVQLKLRPYKLKDAEAIVNWIKDERVLRKWSSDRYGAYPITAEDINYKYLKCNGDCEEADNFYPMTAVDENGPVGHLILRYTNAEKTTIRFGFIIVDDNKRGRGYGKRMIQMAIDELNAHFVDIKGVKIIAADGATNYMRECVDAVDEATFDVWMKYRFSICERMDC